jgi:tRNA-splicing ligase RtcB (3'-phosphate/5'-hydroxy nucleic acid ligase)
VANFKYACRASQEVLEALGVPAHWAQRCEDAFHVGADGTSDALAARLDWHIHHNTLGNVYEKFRQLGSYGGGNHFGECEVVELTDRADPVAEFFGLKHDHVAFLSHCGSRGLGHNLAAHQFKTLQAMFAKWSIPLPGNDRELVYAPLGTPEADAYLNDLAIGSNFATVNHMLINALVLEAFQEIIPGTTGELVYFISHNIARKELDQGKMSWVHRKGATRAFPANHPGLKGSRFESTGHPILLPGNPRDGSAVMVALPGAEKSAFSVNHGAGRAMGRKNAARTLDQSKIDQELDSHDILYNGRTYPIDEAPDAYKNFGEVLKSVELAELARPVAKLKARFVLKDSSAADD